MRKTERVESPEDGFPLTPENAKRLKGNKVPRKLEDLMSQWPLDADDQYVPQCLRAIAEWHLKYDRMPNLVRKIYLSAELPHEQDMELLSHMMETAMAELIDITLWGMKTVFDDPHLLEYFEQLHAGGNTEPATENAEVPVEAQAATQ